MASLKSIAARAKVSMATASRALNDRDDVDPRTRERIRQLAQDLNYQSPSSRRGELLAERKLDAVVAPATEHRAETGSIGLVQTKRSGFYDYDALLMRGMIDAAADNRFDVTWIDMSRDKSDNESYTEFFRRKGLRGVVLRAFRETRHIVEAIAAENFPAIAVGEKFDQPHISWIRNNSETASRQAIEHLISLGHRRIALVVHTPPTTNHMERTVGFRTAMQNADIPIIEDMILSIPVGPRAGEAAINRLMALPIPPTAIYFTDPEVTIGAINRCHDLKLNIPELLSIVGFDDGSSRHNTWLPFAAVCQETRRLGAEASEWLARKLAGSTLPPLASEIQAYFEVLESVGVPPARQQRIMPDGTRLEVE